MTSLVRSLLVGLLVLISPKELRADEPYQEIRVLLPPGKTLLDLNGFRELEVMGLGDGDVRLLSRPTVTQELSARGWSVEVIHSDLQAHYAGRMKSSGESGAWHTYEETVAEIRGLRGGHANIISEPFSIGRSVEGRDIWAIRISDNPDTQEDEPEVLFDAVHHAREIMTVELLLAFANYVCAHYPDDPVVRDLVENRQIYLVPVVNPDGFAYNEQISPGGGGMWRKNRRPNPGGCPGVDNNRNYPFQWGRSDGSSGAPCAEDYRGPGAASEPENQAMMAFVNAHNFVTHNSFHSVAGMILIPWCYTSEPAPADATLRLVVAEMASANGYRTGQCPQLLYQTSGDFLDWTYGDTDNHPPVLSFTTEIGGTGFWPHPAEKEGLILENLPSILYLAQIAGPVLRVDEVRVVDEDGDLSIEPGEECVVLPAVRNDGVIASARGVSGHLRSDDPYVEMMHASSEIGSVGPGEVATSETEPLRFRVAANCPQSRRAPFTLSLRGEGGIANEVPITLTIGTTASAYANEFEQPVDAWLDDPSTTAAHGQFVRVDPNPTAYQPGGDATPESGVNAWITGQNSDEATDDVDEGVAASRSPMIDLSSAGGAYLTLSYFHGQRDGGDDPDGDGFRIDVSSDGGGSWVNLISIGDQATAPVWRELGIDLGDVIRLSDQVCLRVQVADGPADGDLIEGGIDAVRIATRDVANRAPGAPGLLAPPDSASQLSAQPTLTIADASDPEGDPMTYGFRVYGDPDLTKVVASADRIAPGSGSTSWRLFPALAMGTYFWRAFAADPYQWGFFSEVGTFSVVDTTGGMPPAHPAIAAGPNPARGTIRIRYALPATLTSGLAIYDPRGRLVRRLETVPSDSGWQEIEWDGLDDAGRRVASGPYWIRLWTPSETRTLQVVQIN